MSRQTTEFERIYTEEIRALLVERLGRLLWFGLFMYPSFIILDLILAELNGPPTGTELRRAGVAAFVAAHEQLLADSSTTSGSTLTVCCVNATRSEVTTLHSGDSVARLVGSKSTALALCEDHRIDTSESERARLGKLGAKIARAVDEHGRPAGPLLSGRRARI